MCSDITGYFFPFNTEHTQKIPPVCHRHNNNNNNNEIKFVFVIVWCFFSVFQLSKVSLNFIKKSAADDFICRGLNFLPCEANMHVSS